MFKPNIMSNFIFLLIRTLHFIVKYLSILTNASTHSYIAILEPFANMHSLLYLKGGIVTLLSLQHYSEIIVVILPVSNKA